MKPKVYLHQLLTIAEFTDAVERIDADDDARVLILTGAGDKAFVAGADISEFTEAGALDARRMAEAGGGVIEKLERLRFSDASTREALLH